MSKKIIVRQYVEMMRVVEVTVGDDEDIDIAADIANNLPLSADAVPENVATVISDWEYIQDSDDFEDEDGNSVAV